MIVFGFQELQALALYVSTTVAFPSVLFWHFFASIFTVSIAFELFVPGLESVKKLNEKKCLYTTSSVALISTQVRLLN
jgi:hypothetical protein